MDKKQKLEMLQKLSEQELTKKFLIPLFESKGMGYKSVRRTHKPSEFGKDMICYKDEEIGRRKFTCVQAKATKIRTGDVDGILRQINEAFGEPFTDLDDGEKKKVHTVVVLTSSEFVVDAQNSLYAALRPSNLDVVFRDGNQLVDLIDKYLPSAFWDEYDYFTKYFEAMKSDFETIKDISAIGQREPIPLEDIYVSLRVSEKVTEREIPIDRELKIFEQDLMRTKPERGIERQRVIDADKAVKDYNRLVIVGAPGSGKTTLLKHLALSSCHENLKEQGRTCVPIPVTLREFADSEKGLRAYIDDVFEKYQFPRAKEFVEKDLREGRCRLLLDGFDELATKEKQDAVVGEIHKFIGAYPKVQVVVTSRLAGYHDELKGFTKLELMEFDDKQIGRFIENWFGKTDPGKAQSMFNAIDKNGPIKAIARNPLMVAIIAIIYEEDEELPQKRAVLYDRCVDVLLSRWDVQKRLKNKYTPKKKEFLLRKLAFYGHINNKRVLTEKEVMSVMLEYLPEVKLAEKDARPLLDEIWQRSYLLRQISRYSYDFLHLSFQEFFTALELTKQPDGNSTIIKHLPEPWWQEPALLYAGISGQATALINRIRKEVKEDIFYSNLMLFGRCAADDEFTEPALKEEIVNKLWSLYQTAEFSSLKKKAIKILALMKPDNIIDLLIGNLKATESDVRGSAADALGSLGSEKAIEPLIEALTTDTESDVRWRAADALGSIGSEKAIEPLIQALTTAKDSDVRWRAASVLGILGSDKAIEPLKSALKDEGEWMGEKVKDAAFASLEMISRRTGKRITIGPA